MHVYVELGKDKGVVSTSDPVPAFQCCVPPPTFLGKERVMGKKKKGREGRKEGGREGEREREREELHKVHTCTRMTS